MEVKHSNSNHWATNHTGSHEKSHLALAIILQIENYQAFGLFWFFFSPSGVADKVTQF